MIVKLELLVFWRVSDAGLLQSYFVKFFIKLGNLTVNCWCVEPPLAARPLLGTVISATRALSIPGL